MTKYVKKRFSHLFDRDSAVFENLAFEECLFDRCVLNVKETPTNRSLVRNVQFKDCVAINHCDIGPAILEEVIVDGLKTDDLLICWGPFFKHVTLRGKIAKVMINLEAFAGMDRSHKEFGEARRAFYERVDWALDISEAEFVEFEMDGIPARLVRRDPATQVVVTRAKAMQSGWRSKVAPWNNFWPFVINDIFLELHPDSDDIILVAPKGAKKKEFRKLLDGLDDLRQLGVAELD
jgi:hypothetical protein